MSPKINRLHLDRTTLSEAVKRKLRKARLWTNNLGLHSTVVEELL
jgi:hypothetical protein